MERKSNKLSYTNTVLSTKGRWDIMNDCVSKAKDDIDFSPYFGIAFLVNAYGVDSGAVGPGPVTLPIGGKTTHTKAYGLVAFSRS